MFADMLHKLWIYHRISKKRLEQTHCQLENFEKWYNENYYEVEADSMEFTYRLFDVDNTILSPDTSCFLPRSINRINKRNYQLIELVKQYECFMPDNVRKHCEKLCEVLTNGKVE